MLPRCNQDFSRVKRPIPLFNKLPRENKISFRFRTVSIKKKKFDISIIHILAFILPIYISIDKNIFFITPKEYLSLDNFSPSNPQIG